MGALTPQFLIDFETRLSTISENEYLRLSSNLWWDQIATKRTTLSKKEIVSWLITGAMIRERGQGGNYAFDDIAAHYTELETKFAGAGFKISKAQLTDVFNGIAGGEGLELGAEWAAQIGAYMSYWPQKQVAYFLKNAHTASIVTGYDSKAFFATDHPVNPRNTAAGTFSNLLTGAGTYAIDSSIADDVALVNLTKVFAHIATIKMPNGEDPRFLRPKGILCGPTLAPRVSQLVDAKFIAKTAGSGAGSADVQMLMKRLGYAPPIQADELAGFESDTTYFVVCEQAATSQLGPVLYLEREAFAMNQYGPQTEAELARRNEFEWLVDGRNSVAPGHPYLLVKVKAT